MRRKILLLAALCLPAVAVMAQQNPNEGRGASTRPAVENYVIKTELPTLIPLSDQDDPSKDQVINDDLVVVGGLGAGTGMYDGYLFPFKTIVMRANNTRLYFDDNSTGTFPANDWMIEANSSVDAGPSYLAFRDSTNGTLPFMVRAAAPDYSLFVEGTTGNIGLRTSAPAEDIHLVRGDTPTLRLEQDATMGWTAQTWDIAGNEANFFVRDVTGGSRLPFRIAPGAPTSSLTVQASGNVGIGTWYPSQKLEVKGSMKLAPSFVPASPTAGTFYVDTADYHFKYYDGTQWNTFAADTDTDEQDLVAATLTGSVLQIDIENGASVSVDLAPLLADLEARVTALEALVGAKENESGKNYLLQNSPNPFSGATSIAYYISHDVTNAMLVINDVRGNKIREIAISNRGEGIVQIADGDLSVGTYFYSLILDGQKSESKILVKVE